MLVKKKMINRHKEEVENEQLRKDNTRHAKHCNIKLGDNVLIKQDMRNKLNSRYNEKPLIVVH